MNKKIFKIIGPAGFIGICSLFPVQASMAASDNPLNESALEEERYISEVLTYCAETLFGEEEIREWSPRNEKAYKSCLREYGVMYHYEVDLDDIDWNESPPRNPPGYEKLFGSHLTEEEILSRTETEIENIREKGIDELPYSLTDKGRAAVEERLKNKESDAAHDIRSHSKAGSSPVDKEKEQVKPSYIYKKPKEGKEDDIPSRVFKGYQ